MKFSYKDIIIFYLSLCGIFAHFWFPFTMTKSGMSDTIIGGLTGLFGNVISSIFLLLNKIVGMFADTLDKILTLDSNSTLGALIIGIVLTEVIRWLFNRKKGR